MPHLKALDHFFFETFEIDLIIKVTVSWVQSKNKFFAQTLQETICNKKNLAHCKPLSPSSSLIMIKGIP